MPITNFPNGVTSFGIPILGSARFSNPWSTHYFVDGDDGSDGHNGKSPQTAFATIQKAVTASTGGDVIYIKPKTYTMATGFARYEEDVVIPSGASGTGTTATQANKSLIGITPRTTASDFMGVRWKYATNTNLNVEAPGTHIENIGFFCEDATAGVYFEGDGTTLIKSGIIGSSLYNCAIKGDGGVLANGSDSLQIIGNQFQAKYDGTVCGMTITVGSTITGRRPVLKGNHFLGGNGVAMSAAPVIWTGQIENALITDNDFDTGTLVQINIVTASTGLIARNYFAETDLSTTFIVQNGMICVDNYDLTGLAASA